LRCRLVGARRSDDAANPLYAAPRVFEELGAEPWAHRAREAIEAAVGVAPNRRINRLERLAPLELEVALATVAGAPLDDVANQLFLGPRTARLLLASAMVKLGVDSTDGFAATIGPERAPHATVT
jgi:DNA-binding CsgD family transcriptional regulator